jgi:hypothetical protein
MTDADDDLERQLRELPSRGLASGAHGRIRAAMAASAPSPRPIGFWSRPLPMRYALAASLVLCAGTALLVRALAVGALRIDAAPVAARVELPLPATEDRRPTDIRRWTRVEVRTEAGS